MMLARIRSLLVAGAISALLSPAWCHFPFSRYLRGEAGEWLLVPAKFDLDSLPGRAVQYFLVSPLPVKYAAGDDLQSLLAQIRLAAETWNSVSTSALRLKFGGFRSVDDGRPWGPGIYITFEDFDTSEGILARGGPVLAEQLTESPTGPFFRIERSVIQLPLDFSNLPTRSESFFTTLVHEFGHAIGLQHTFTTSAMATAATRTTTRAAPLAEDDIAGVSALYPARDFYARRGTIRGSVKLDGLGVHLASVVALAPSGGAVSTLSKPDGSFELTGLPPGLYYLYVHPLPPAVNPMLGPGDLLLPVDPGGDPVPAGPLFRSVFYPSTQLPSQAWLVSVKAGSTVEGLELEVQSTDTYRTFGVATYSCPGDYCLRPAYVNVNHPTRNYLLVWGPGLVIDGAPAPDLEVSLLGGSSLILWERTRVYAPYGPEGPAFLQLYLNHHLMASPGPRHLVFRFADDLYVLPDGLHVTAAQPPSISEITVEPATDGSLVAILKGSNLHAATRVLIDGVPAPQVSFDWDTGELRVRVPPAPTGRTVPVIALDRAGQSSDFLDALRPLEQRSIIVPDRAGLVLTQITPVELEAGSEVALEITAAEGAQFDPQWTWVGFGTPDIAVRKLWVVSPTKLMLSVRASEFATPGPVSLAIVNGLELLILEDALTVAPAGITRPHPDPVLVNPVTGRKSVYPGGEAVLFIRDLPAEAGASIQIRLSDYPVEILGIEGNQVKFRVPPELVPGPALLSVSIQGIAFPPLATQIDPPPPVILAVTTPFGFMINETNPVGPGDFVIIYVAGLLGGPFELSPQDVDVMIGGVPHEVTYANQRSSGLTALWVRVDDRVPPGSAVPLIVGAREWQSPAVDLWVRASE